MYVLKNICFVCLTDCEQNLKTLLHNNTEDEIFTHVKCVLPELATLDSDIPVYICSSCSITFSNYCMFKKRCLRNYSRWKHYIQILQETSNTQKQSFSELKIRLINCVPLIKQEQDLDIEVNIKEESEDPILSSSERKEQILNDLKMEIYDNKPLIKLEPDVHIASNTKELSETVVEDKIVVKEELIEQDENITIEICIKNENEDSFQSWEDQYHEKDVEDNFEEEWLASEDSADQDLNQQPEFDNLTYEVSNDEQDGGSSVISEHNYAIDLNNPKPSEEFKCILCNEMFLDKSIFDTHLKNHIDNLTGMKCVICKDLFSKTSILKRHMEFHLNIKDYECSICHMKYTNQISLNFHLQIHRPPTVYECEVCNKRYASKKGLKVHMRIHLGIKDFECTICGKKFGRKSTLTEHLKLHSGIKDFECTVCNKKFTQKWNLRKHMKSFGCLINTQNHVLL